MVLPVDRRNADPGAAPTTSVGSARSARGVCFRIRAGTVTFASSDGLVPPPKDLSENHHRSRELARFYVAGEIAMSGVGVRKSRISSMRASASRSPRSMSAAK
jgi:hypothetical protein